MPNNVTNILTVSGDPKRMAALFEAVKVDEYGPGSLDFAKVIPMPDDIYRGNLGKAEFAKYGKSNWMDWSIEHWGSKWNSYGYNEYTAKEFDGSSLRFQTAWSDVHQVIECLAQQYPDLQFSYLWADEDLGSNVGQREYENGEETECYIPDNHSREALELAADIHEIALEDEGYLWSETTGDYEFHPEAMGLELS